MPGMSVSPFFATSIAFLATLLTLFQSPPRKFSKYGSSPVACGSKRSKNESSSASLIDARSCSRRACAMLSSIVSACARTGSLHSLEELLGRCSSTPVSPNGAARSLTASHASWASSRERLVELLVVELEQQVAQLRRLGRFGASTPAYSETNGVKV